MENCEAEGCLDKERRYDRGVKGKLGKFRMHVSEEKSESLQELEAVFAVLFQQFRDATGENIAEALVVINEFWKMTDMIPMFSERVCQSGFPEMLFDLLMNHDVPVDIQCKCLPSIMRLFRNCSFVREPSFYMRLNELLSCGHIPTVRNTLPIIGLVKKYFDDGFVVLMEAGIVDTVMTRLCRDMDDETRATAIYFLSWFVEFLDDFGGAILIFIEAVKFYRARMKIHALRGIRECIARNASLISILLEPKTEFLSVLVQIVEKNFAKREVAFLENGALDVIFDIGRYDPASVVVNGVVGLLNLPFFEVEEYGVDKDSLSTMSKIIGMLFAGGSSEIIAVLNVWGALPKVCGILRDGAIQKRICVLPIVEGVIQSRDVDSMRQLCALGGVGGVVEIFETNSMDLVSHVMALLECLVLSWDFVAVTLREAGFIDALEQFIDDETDDVQMIEKCRMMLDSLRASVK